MLERTGTFPDESKADYVSGSDGEAECEAGSKRDGDERPPGGPINDNTGRDGPDAAPQNQLEEIHQPPTTSRGTSQKDQEGGEDDYLV